MRSPNHIDREFGSIQSPPGSFSSEIDLEKLYTVLAKSWIWILVIIVITNISAYLVIRWTKPVFESYSDLRLNIKNDASVLGLLEVNEEASLNNLSGEIELLKSKLFFDKVIQTLDLDISYYSVGNILEDEKYRSSPFKVRYNLNGGWAYDKYFTVVIENQEQFILSFPNGSNIPDKVCKFGENIETEHISLRLNLNKPVEQIGEQRLYSFRINSRPSLINYIDENLNVEPLNLTANTIRISFRDHNRFKARDLVNAIDTIYLGYSKETKNKANQQRIAFLDDQLLLTQHKLQDYETYFESFTIRNKTTDVQSDLNTTIKAIAALDSQNVVLQKKLSNLQELQSNLTQKVGQPESLLQYSGYNEDINTTLHQLDELVKERELLKISYNDNTFAVTKVDQQINSLRQQLGNFLSGYEKELKDEGLVIRSKRLTLEQRLRTLPAQGTEFTSNQRNFSLYEEFLLTLMQLKAEFQVAQAGTVTDFVILSAAILPDAPVFPNKLIIYGLGIVSGLIFSFLFVGVRYALHNKITSQSELERITTLPILGVVPRYLKEKLDLSKLIIDKNPKSPVSESLRSIRTNMEFLKVSSAKKIISVTSTVSGEGKTFLAINLGGIISLSKQRVLLVDMDMRRPKIHLAFDNIEVNKGLSTILIQKHSLKECLVRTSLEHLDYLPAGPTPPNPSELIMGPEVDELLDQMKQDYDTIILDTPPVGLVTDGILAMKKADIPVYVIRADYSRKDFVNTLNRLATTNRFNNLSIVLNSVQITNKKGYGYGYGYGKGYYE
ncbi:MAG: tyrosine protein kinase [Cyclobacteriaceae bacterium]|nr:MAG: tyrosine protein kinase [Cyclobacteriaceae bacterium]